MLSATAKRRLSKLVEFMAGLPREANKHFYMGQWFAHTGDHPLAKKGAELSAKHLADCGTSACALGWAATIPAFKRAGLKVTFNDNGGGWMKLGKKVYSYSEGFTAGEKFFDLEDFQSRELFGSDDSIKTPKQWARKASKLLKTWEANPV